MKMMITVVFFVFTFHTSAQSSKNDDPRLQPYVGTWTAQYDQNKVFELTLWQEHEVLKGNYKLTILDGSGNIIDVYKSNFIHPNTNQEMPSMIYATADSNNYISGVIHDITINVGNGLSNRKSKVGNFGMTLHYDLDGSTMADWTVEDNRHVVLEGYPEHFSIPTDIVLTKTE